MITRIRGLHSQRFGWINTKETVLDVKYVIDMGGHWKVYWHPNINETKINLYTYTISKNDLLGSECQGCLAAMNSELPYEVIDDSRVCDRLV